MDRAVAIVAALLVPVALACASSDRVTVPRSATEQILSTEAIDRVLAKLEWPEVAGKKLVVQVGGPVESHDRDYLYRSVEVMIAEGGGIVVLDEDVADYELNVLVGAVGIDSGGRLVGLKGTANSMIIPFTIPELALYKSSRLDGFAKAEIALLDHKNGGVLFRSGPAYGTTYRQTRTFLFVFGWRWTDVTRLPRSKQQTEQAY